MPKKMKVKVKVWHQSMYRLEYEGTVWHLDVADWRMPGTSDGEIRVYKVHGDITSPLLPQALEQLAAERSLIGFCFDDDRQGSDTQSELPV